MIWIAYAALAAEKAELEERIAKVRRMAVNANDGCAYCVDAELVDAREILAVLDNQGGER